MAKFKEGDWVEITPQPDPLSRVWNSYLHDKFCGWYGTIYNIAESEGNVSLNIRVFFEEGVFGDEGYRYAWFEDKHVLLSSEWEANRKVALQEEYEEYMRAEKKMKQKRDEMLSEIFTPEHLKKKEKPKKEEVLTDREYDTDDEEASYGVFDIMDLYNSKP